MLFYPNKHRYCSELKGNVLQYETNQAAPTAQYRLLRILPFPSRHQSPPLDSCTEVEHKPWKSRKYDPHTGQFAILVRSTWEQFKSKWSMLSSEWREPSPGYGSFGLTPQGNCFISFLEDEHLYQVMGTVFSGNWWPWLETEIYWTFKL